MLTLNTDDSSIPFFPVPPWSTRPVQEHSLSALPGVSPEDPGAKPCSHPTLTKINQNKQQKMEEDTVTAPAVSLNCPKECLVNLVENTPFIQILCTSDNKF